MPPIGDQAWVKMPCSAPRAESLGQRIGDRGELADLFGEMLHPPAETVELGDDQDVAGAQVPQGCVELVPGGELA